MIEHRAPLRATSLPVAPLPPRPIGRVADTPDQVESAAAGFAPGRPPAGGWDPWFLEHDGHLQAVARRVMGTALEADDAAQEARLACLDGLGRYGGDEAGLRAWLAVMVRNRLANQARRAAARPRSPLGAEAMAMVGPGEGPWAAHDRDLLVAAVRAALAEAKGRFPGAGYLAIVLRCGEGQSTAEVAAALGLPEDRVRDRYRRALPRFRAFLARRLGPDLLAIAGVVWVAEDSIAPEVMP